MLSRRDAGLSCGVWSLDSPKPIHDNTLSVIGQLLSGALSRWRARLDAVGLMYEAIYLHCRIAPGSDKGDGFTNMMVRRPDHSEDEPALYDAKDAPAPTCVITDRDRKAILAMTKGSPALETGGDLWGEWVADGCVIKAITGPGAEARHQMTAFFQDADFMLAAGMHLRGQALHIGTWHSHHTLGLPVPSGGDDRTYSIAMREYNRDRFIAFISAIERGKPVVRPYFYEKVDAHIEMTKGKFEIADDTTFPDHSVELARLAKTAAKDARSTALSAASPVAWVNQGDVATSKVLPNTIAALAESPLKHIACKPSGSNFLVIFAHDGRPDKHLTLSLAPDFYTTKTVKLSDATITFPEHVPLEHLATTLRAKVLEHVVVLFAASTNDQQEPSPEPDNMDIDADEDQKTPADAPTNDHHHEGPHPAPSVALV